jgi:hypothetical protein
LSQWSIFSAEFRPQIWLHWIFFRMVLHFVICRMQWTRIILSFPFGSHFWPKTWPTNFVLGADYKTVLEEINGFCRNLSATPRAFPALRYQNGRRDTFAGNLSTEERRSFFTYTDRAVEIPCGFFKDFPIAQAGEFFVLIRTLHIRHEYINRKTLI